jgi:hypothetical protein
VKTKKNLSVNPVSTSSIDLTRVNPVSTSSIDLTRSHKGLNPKSRAYFIASSEICFLLGQYISCTGWCPITSPLAVLQINGDLKLYILGANIRWPRVPEGEALVAENNFPARQYNLLITCVEAV